MRTQVSIHNDDFWIDGAPTYEGVSFGGRRVEGLLMNSRMVQATFDDLNPETRVRWAYPDRSWDPDHNTTSFIEQLPTYKAHGLLAFTINFQGGSPEGYSEEQPWINSAFDPDGALRPDYAGRIKRVVEAADELGMIVIVGLFYFGQDEYLTDEKAVKRATKEAVSFLLHEGAQNVIVEIANEIDVPHYEHAILRPDRCHELIQLVQAQSDGQLPVGTSFAGGALAAPDVVAASDVIFLHGNGVDDPGGIREMVRLTRRMPEYAGQPIVINEDDHYAFDQPDNNLRAAVDEHASWGFFDFRREGEGFECGYQSVPVDWSIHSPRKREFFTALKEITG